MSVIHASMKTRFLLLKIRHFRILVFSALITAIVFLPWQLYILNMFPVESALSYAHNRQHIFEVLGGHSGTVWFHLNWMRTSYGQYLLPFLLIGTISIIRDKAIDRALSLSLYAMILIVYAFFSIIVATKMPALTYLVNSLVIIVIASGIISSYNFVFTRILKCKKVYKSLILFLIFISSGIYSLKPWNIANHRSSENIQRNHKINNTQIYQSLADSICQKYIVLNCKSFEDIELMFHKDVNAYHWFPPEQIIDSLENLGYNFAAFQSHTNQGLPEYMLQNNNILIIQEKIK